MLVKVTKVNFYSDNSWIFKFEDSSGTEYVALDALTYSKFGLVSPINKAHLDRFDIGVNARVNFEVIGGTNIVTSIG